MVRALVMALVLAGCRWDFEHVGEMGSPDGTVMADALGDAPSPGVDAAPLGPFSPPAPVIALTLVDHADDPTLTEDLLEIYLNNEYNDRNILVSTRVTAADDWSTPAVVPELSSAEDETAPEVSPDGLTIYFARAPLFGDPHDVYVSTRTARDQPWGAPSRVAELSTAGDDGGASTSADQRLLYVYSSALGTMDVWVSERGGAGYPWPAPTRIEELATSADEWDPGPDRDGRLLYFSRGPWNACDIYGTQRAASTLPYEPTIEMTELNSPANDRDPWISPDGRVIYFYSNRNGIDTIWTASR